MALGAAEIALAAHALDAPAGRYLRESARWLRGHVDSGDTDTLNLYDVGALADVALARAMKAIRHGNRLAMTRADLVARPGGPDRAGSRARRRRPVRRRRGRGRVRRQLPHVRPGRDRRVVRPAHPHPPLPGLRRRPNGPGCSAATPGASARWWGSARPSRCACSTRSPTSPEAPTAAAPLDVGAVVNGPNGADNFEGGLGGFQTGMVHCAATEARGLRRYDGKGGRFVDDVRAWQTDEPALDMTGAAIIAAAAQLALHPRRADPRVPPGVQVKPGTPSLLRGINDRAALDLLLEHGPLSRTRLGELTGLSKPTASQLLSRLADAGLVVTSGNSQGGPGPRAQLYAVNPARGVRRRAGRHAGRHRGRRRRHHRPGGRRVRAAHPAAAPAGRGRPRRRGAGRRGRLGRRGPRAALARRHRHARRLRPEHPAAALRPAPPGLARPRTCSSGSRTRSACRSTSATTSTSPPSPSCARAGPAASTTSCCCGPTRASAPRS